MGELGRFRAREDSRHAALEAWDERARNTSAERSSEFIALAREKGIGQVALYAQFRTIRQGRRGRRQINYDYEFYDSGWPVDIPHDSGIEKYVVLEDNTTYQCMVGDTPAVRNARQAGEIAHQDFRITTATATETGYELALQYPFGGPDGLRVLDRALRAHEQ